MENNEWTMSIDGVTVGGLVDLQIEKPKPSNCPEKGIQRVDIKTMSVKIKLTSLTLPLSMLSPDMADRCNN